MDEKKKFDLQRVTCSRCGERYDASHEMHVCKNVKTCDARNGRGKLYGYDDLGKCWYCNGTGTVTETWKEKLAVKNKSLHSDEVID